MLTSESCAVELEYGTNFDTFEVAVTTGGGRGLVMGDIGGRGLAGMVGEEGEEECFGAEGGGREMATSDMMDV